MCSGVRGHGRVLVCAQWLRRGEGDRGGGEGGGATAPKQRRSLYARSSTQVTAGWRRRAEAAARVQKRQGRVKVWPLAVGWACALAQRPWCANGGDRVRVAINAELCTASAPSGAKARSWAPAYAHECSYGKTLVRPRRGGQGSTRAGSGHARPAVARLRKRQRRTMVDQGRDGGQAMRA